MRLDKLLAATFLAATLAGCADESVSVAPGDGRVVLSPGFSFNGPAAVLPIEFVELSPIIQEGQVGTPLDAVRRRVDPNDPTWTIRAPIDLGERDSALILVLVEMLSVASGSEIVEWSGVIGPIMVHADEPNPLPNQVELFRGPLHNQSVLDVFVSGPSFLSLGQTAQAHAGVQTTGTAHTVIWVSRNESVVTVDPVGDTVDVVAVGPGSTWVVAAAGAHADSFQVAVSTMTIGSVADVMAMPDSAVMVVGSTRTWQAIAFDSLGFPVATSFTWQTLDASIATVSGAGEVVALAVGRARIVVSAGGFADTAIVNVQTLPAGIDLIWQGGTAGFVDDWFTADNWSPSRVPTATDVVYIPQGSQSLVLRANAEVGGLIADTTGAYYLYMGGNTLTVHGDLRAPYISSDSTARIVMDGANATLWGYAIPALTILGDVTMVGDTYVNGDVEIDGRSSIGHLEVGSDWVLYATGDLRVLSGSIGVASNATTFNDGVVYITGDALFDGGDSSGSLTGGYMVIGGDFTVTAATCTAFAPTGTAVELYSDATRISIGCASRTGNRFHDLFIYQVNSTIERIVELQSDVIVMNEFYLHGGSGSRVIGNGRTIDIANGFGSIYTATFDRAFLEVERTDATGWFYVDSLRFTGMTGETRPQLIYSHVGVSTCGGCYDYMQIFFDPTSTGPYLEVHDPVANGNSLILYMAENPGDGPARTVTTGEARVYWADVPFNLYYWSGSGQTGARGQPLAAPFVVKVADYASYPVAGVTVNWTVTMGNGSVNPTSSVSGQDGLASTVLTLGDSPLSSANQVIATSSAVPTDTVYFVGYPNPAPAGVTRSMRANEAVTRRPESRPAPARERRPAAWPDRPEPLESARIPEGDRR